MATAIASSLANVPARHDVAMTGEITLPSDPAHRRTQRKNTGGKARSHHHHHSPQTQRKRFRRTSETFTERREHHSCGNVDQVYAAALHVPSRARTKPKTPKPSQPKRMRRNRTKRRARRETGSTSGGPHRSCFLNNEQNLRTRLPEDGRRVRPYPTTQTSMANVLAAGGAGHWR